MGQHDDRDVVPDGVVEPGIAFHQAHFMAAAQHAGQALRDVEVGREIALFRDDDSAVRPFGQCRRQQLEQVDRSRIGADDLFGFGADEGGKLGAAAPWHVVPVVGVPALDQVEAPLVFDQLADAVLGDMGQGAQRVAVQIDHAVGQIEALAHPRQRIVGVARQQVVSCQGRHRRFRRSVFSGGQPGREHSAAARPLELRKSGCRPSRRGFATRSWRIAPQPLLRMKLQKK